MRKYGLIGYPLTSSFSPDHFDRKFEKEAIADCQYKTYPLQSLSGFRVWFFEENLSGLNVTIPYKQDVIPFLDRLDPLARAVGAVNCIALEGDQLVGYNTDVDGFARSIVPFIENKFERALVIGTGGASKAVAFALKRWGMKVIFLTRQPVNEDHLGYDALSVANVGMFPLIVNCTPVGTAPEVSESPEIPYAGLSDHHFLYDLIYNPAETSFLKQGKAQGALVMNGRKMLEIQADLSWDIWQSSH